MASKTEIAKWALDLVGQPIISSYDDVGTVGDKVRLHYPVVVETLLEKHPLFFSERRAVLAQLVSSDDPYWAYAYGFPAGMLHLHRLEPTTKVLLTAPIKYMIRNETIYTDESSAVAIYSTGDIEPGKFTALFADGVSWLLAARLAVSFRTGQFEPRELEKTGREKIDEAVAAAARSLSFRPMDIASRYERAFGSPGDTT